MALFRFYLLSAAICSVLVVGHGLEEAPTKPPVQIIDLKNLKISVPDTTLMPETTIHPDTTTHPDTTSTTIPSTTSTTTPSTTSTTTPSTTSTTTPSTTSTTPSTTSSTTPSTTTSTTTQAPPSPTPKPVPGPPEMGKWTYSDKNVTCIMVQFAAQLNVTYPMANVSTLGSKFVNVPANASTTAGWCGAANQSLTISWPATADENNTIAIVFQINDTTKSYEVKNITVKLVPAMFPNITNMDVISLYHGAEWRTPLATSYRCAAPTTLALTAAEPSEASVGAKMTLSQLQEEAFRTASATGFSAARDCAGGDIPDAVPIAVGCALGGMVVVVLIAYLVARRRSAARGYLSM